MEKLRLKIDANFKDNNEPMYMVIEEDFNGLFELVIYDDFAVWEETKFKTFNEALEAVKPALNYWSRE